MVEAALLFSEELELSYVEVVGLMRDNWEEFQHQIANSQLLSSDFTLQHNVSLNSTGAVALKAGQTLKNCLPGLKTIADSHHEKLGQVQIEANQQVRTYLQQKIKQNFDSYLTATQETGPLAFIFAEMKKSRALKEVNNCVKGIVDLLETEESIQNILRAKDSNLQQDALGRCIDQAVLSAALLRQKNKGSFTDNERKNAIDIARFAFYVDSGYIPTPYEDDDSHIELSAIIAKKAKLPKQQVEMIWEHHDFYDPQTAQKPLVVVQPVLRFYEQLRKGSDPYVVTQKILTMAKEQKLDPIYTRELANLVVGPKTADIYQTMVQYFDRQDCPNRKLLYPLTDKPTTVICTKDTCTSHLSHYDPADAEIANDPKLQQEKQYSVCPVSTIILSNKRRQQNP